MRVCVPCRTKEMEFRDETSFALKKYISRRDSTFPENIMVVVEAT